MKNKSSLEERILETALRLFNENGIEYVGMRELATQLGIRIGNLTYYFPTKDDLVNRLSVELGAENSKVIVPLEEITFDLFFSMLGQVFRNHTRYRCLLLSFVHIMERNPHIAARYRKTQSVRNETWSRNIQALRDAKFLKADDKQVEFLVSTIGLIARFWISEAAVSFRSQTEEQQIEHYIKMIARIFLPYATAKGRRSLTAVIAE